MSASNFEPAPMPDAIVEFEGTKMMRDAKGRLQPQSTVRDSDVLMDQTVRTIVGFHIAASEQIARLKQHTFEDIETLVDLLAEQYGTKLGAGKGNITLHSYDGLFKVTLQVAELLEFGPELQIAKSLVDECLNEWTTDSRDELRAVVTRAFNTDKAGQINRSEIFRILRLKIEDERWENAMEAIRDAIRVVGTTEYVRCHRRAKPTDPWQHITTDMAKV